MEVREESWVGNETKWEYLRVMYERYGKAQRKARGGLLDEFCVTTGYNRKYAIRLLNGPAPENKRPKRIRGRKARYGKAAMAVLAAVWEAAGYPWSVRLKALLPNWMPWIRKRYRIRPEVEATPGDERAADGSAAAEQEKGTETQDLRTHQTRNAAEAPHSNKDRQLGRQGTWVRRDRSGLAFR